MDLGGTNFHEFQSHWPTVVMCHAVVGGDCDIVAGPDHFTGGEANRVSLEDLFRESLGIGRGGWLLSREESGGIWSALKLPWEDVLPPWMGRSVGTELERGYEKQWIVGAEL
jgi:hypothetical protein